MKNTKRTINVVFVNEESSNCRQIFKDLNSNNYYCRIEKEAVWCSFTSEPDCPINANFNICDLQGNIITDDSLYPFMREFVKKECQDIIDNIQTYDSWKLCALEDKETFCYSGDNDSWLYYETTRTEENKVRTLNYLSKEIIIIKKLYEHKISKKRWASFEAILEDTIITLLGYSFEKDKYQKGVCGFPSIEESEKCTNEKCFYFKNDRCTFLDSDTQIMLSGNDEYM